MADEERVGIFASLWRFFTFYRWRKARGIIRAANRQFTGSVQGIDDAFEIQRDKWITEFNGYRDAVAQIKAQTIAITDELKKLNTEEHDLIAKRDGAETMAAQAQEAKDNEAFARHSAAFERYDARIAQIDARQSELENKKKSLDETVKKHMLRLTQMQAEIEALPRQKAEAMADFISAKKIVELNDRMAGLQHSLDRGPLDEVMKNVQELKAKAQISDEMAGADVRLQDEEYSRAGQAEKAQSKLAQRLAARKAEKDAKTAGESATQITEERPKI